MASAWVSVGARVPRAACTVWGSCRAAPCLLLPAAGLPAPHRAVLCCGTAEPALSLQKAMEVPQPLVHIRALASHHNASPSYPKSCVRLPRPLSGTVSVLQQVAAGPCPAQGWGWCCCGTLPRLRVGRWNSATSWADVAEQLAVPEGVRRSRHRLPCPLHQPRQCLGRLLRAPPCCWEEEGVSVAGASRGRGCAVPGGRPAGAHPDPAGPHSRAAARDTTGTQAHAAAKPREPRCCQLPGGGPAAAPGLGQGTVTVGLLAGLATGRRAALEGALAVAIGLAPHCAVRFLCRWVRAHAGFR